VKKKLNEQECEVLADLLANEPDLISHLLTKEHCRLSSQLYLITKKKTKKKESKEICSRFDTVVGLQKKFG
jgi:hypothetical protein